MKIQPLLLVILSALVFASPVFAGQDPIPNRLIDYAVESIKMSTVIDRR